MVVPANGRRTSLGPRASAALPRLHKALAREGITHAELARRADLTTGGLAKILYGVVDPTAAVIKRIARALSKAKAGSKAFEHELGMWVVLWTKPCPPSWRPHDYPDLRRAARERELAATGTDD